MWSLVLAAKIPKSASADNVTFKTQEIALRL